MAAATDQPLLPQEQPRRRRLVWGLAVAALLLVLLLAATGPLRPRLFRAPPPAERVALTLLSGAKEKGAVCVDGTPPGYHLQGGSGSGADGWLVHLEGGGWCSTVKECSGSRLSTKGSFNFMKPIRFMGNGILGGDQLQNPDFYNWNKVYVRYCDGASFSGDAEAHRMEPHYTSEDCVSMKRLLMNSWKKDSQMQHRKDISGKRSLWSLYDRVIHLQNVRKVLPKDCLANKEPTECFFPAELIKSIHTPMFILNPSYDSWQIRNVLVPDSSAPDKSWLSCKENIRNCNSTQVEVLDGLRNKMVNDLKVVEDKEDWGMFIDSCFTHCQSLSGVSWHSPTSPRLENKAWS
ncbi:hypothetical protein TRIUR3_01657 [Triticum urartu]|uniref:Pectin acetylesterase n=1 Tax=Triticum urartu TaxID=4572 RepID=M8AB32_TRIUA|nr:hypothetical protein TRIUR3_01657 [Triticum urartu]